MSLNKVRKNIFPFLGIRPQTEVLDHQLNKDINSNTLAH